MDVVAVHEAGLAAAEHARSGQGPIILEMLTYRYRGHSMSDPAKYRTKEEVDRMRTEHDPIAQLRQRLIDEHVADENELKQIERRDPGYRRRSGAIRPGHAPSRTRPNCGRMCWPKPRRMLLTRAGRTRDRDGREGCRGANG